MFIISRTLERGTDPKSSHALTSLSPFKIAWRLRDYISYSEIVPEKMSKWIHMPKSYFRLTGILSWMNDKLLWASTVIILNEYTCSPSCQNPWYQNNKKCKLQSDDKSCFCEIPFYFFPLNGSLFKQLNFIVASIPLISTHQKDQQQLEFFFQSRLKQQNKKSVSLMVWWRRGCRVITMICYSNENAR